MMMNVNRLFKRPLFAALLLGLVQYSAPVVGQSISLEKKWETPAVLQVPESVLYDKANNVLYTANIDGQPAGKDGKGSIGRVSLDGKVQKAAWVATGLDAPKGMGLHKGLLYVADLTKVVVIDVKSGTVVRNIEAPDAGMLNDITVDAQGVVYVSDSGKAKVYRIVNNKAEVWIQTPELQKPNGLLAHQDKLYLVDMGSGIFYEINKKTKALRKIAEGLSGSDGIVPYGKDFILSTWAGEVNLVTAQGKVEKLLDTKAQKINAADLTYIPEKNLLLIPTFFVNTITAYSIKK
jgi:streptogramin lyase